MVNLRSCKLLLSVFCTIPFLDRLLVCAQGQTDPVEVEEAQMICDDCYRAIIKLCSEVAPIANPQPDCAASGANGNPSSCGWVTIQPPGGGPPQGRWKCGAPVEYSYPKKNADNFVYRVRQSEYNEPGYECFERHENSKVCKIAMRCGCEPKVVGGLTYQVCSRTGMEADPDQDGKVTEDKIPDDADPCNIGWPQGGGTIPSRGAEIEGAN